jgi:hypothetical protein
MFNAAAIDFYISVLVGTSAGSRRATLGASRDPESRRFIPRRLGESRLPISLKYQGSG